MIAPYLQQLSDMSFLELFLAAFVMSLFFVVWLGGLVMIVYLCCRIANMLGEENPRVTYNNPWEVSGERLSVSDKQHSVKD